MARSTPNQYQIRLSSEVRQRLEELTRNGHAPAKKILHAQVLLLSDLNRPDGYQTRTQIAAVLGLHANTVDRIRKLFVLEGEVPALERKPRETPPRPPILDGRSEAQLIAICCSEPPAGRVRWTMELLANELTQRRIVMRISGETVRRTLKKTLCSLGESSSGASRSVTGHASSPRWKRSWTSTQRSTRATNR
jgi:hypothetical protein